MRLTKPIPVRSKLAAPLLAALIVAGCQDGDIYETIYATPHTPITCVRLETDDEITRFVLLKNGDLQALYDPSCPFKLKAKAHYVHSCSAAIAKALGSDFDGYLRLELFEDGKLLYRNQQDFKGALHEGVVANLIERMERSLAIRTKSRAP